MDGTQVSAVTEFLVNVLMGCFSLAVLTWVGVGVQTFLNDRKEEKRLGFQWSAWQAEKLRNLDRFRRQLRSLSLRCRIGEQTVQAAEEGVLLLLDCFLLGRSGIRRFRGGRDGIRRLRGGCLLA